eukprot:1159055-Pelagomonas_calceolata.AAC.10
MARRERICKSGWHRRVSSCAADSSGCAVIIIIIIIIIPSLKKWIAQLREQLRCELIPIVDASSQYRPRNLMCAAERSHIQPRARHVAIYSLELGT